MNSEPGAVFLDRPHGTRAVAIGGGGAALETAVRAVLQTEAGGVLVKSMRRAPDGSYTGEIYGVTPRQRRVAVGDVVTFAEAQIFTFKTPDGEIADTAAAEVAAMARTFEQQFLLLDAQSPPEASAPEPSIPEFSLPPDAPAVVEAAPIRERVEPVLAAPPKLTERPARVEPVLPDPPKPSEGPPRLEPVLPAPPKRIERPARVEPLQADPTPPYVPSAVVEQAGNCIECGAPLTRVAKTEVTGEPLQTSKVSCRECGRINVVATLAYRAATRPSG